MAKKKQAKPQMKIVKVLPDIHATILKEHQQTHTDFWAILDNLIRLGLKARENGLGAASQ